MKKFVIPFVAVLVAAFFTLGSVSSASAGDCSAAQTRNGARACFDKTTGYGPIIQVFDYGNHAIAAFPAYQSPGTNLYAPLAYGVSDWDYADYSATTGVLGYDKCCERFYTFDATLSCVSPKGICVPSAANHDILEWVSNLSYSFHIAS